MRHAIALAAATLALAPAAAGAQVVKLAAGEEVVVALDAGAATELARRPAGFDAFETMVAAEFARGDHADATGAGSKPAGRSDATVPAPVPEPARIRLRFLRDPANGHALLVIANGYGGAVAYRARIARADRSGATDVCIVPPGKLGIEHWPFEVDTIELSALRLEAWAPGDPIRCE